jgi:hypothetical protein
MFTPRYGEEYALKRWTPEYVALLFMSGWFRSIEDSYNAEIKALVERARAAVVDAADDAIAKVEQRHHASELKESSPYE